MIAKISPIDSQKRWVEKFIDILKDLDSIELSVKVSCEKLNIMRVSNFHDIYFAPFFFYLLLVISSYHHC